MQYDKIITEIFFKNNKYNCRAIVRINKNKKKYSNIVNYLNNRYSDSESAKETIYRLRNNIEKVPGCEVCGKHTRFIGSMMCSPDKAFRRFCSCTCRNLCEEVRNRMNETCIKRYGKGNGYNKQKAIKTNIERYGVSSYAKTKEFKENFSGDNHPMKKQKCKEIFDIFNNEQKYKDSHLDNIIIKVLFTNDLLNKNYRALISVKKRNKYINILRYLYNRFEDSETIFETVQRIRLHIEERPKCKVCRKTLKFYRASTKTNKFFRTYCSIKCENNDPEVLQKQWATKIEKYGDIWHSEKCKETMIKIYGVDNYFKSQEYKDKMTEIAEKEYHGFADGEIEIDNLKVKSKLEAWLYRALEKKYGRENISYEYYSELYPYPCDFYIKPLDIYIELQGDSNHGTHPFDYTNKKDYTKATRLIKNKNFNFFTVWCKRDVEKRETAKKNNLRWYETFAKTEKKLIEFVNTLPNK